MSQQTELFNASEITHLGAFKELKFKYSGTEVLYPDNDIDKARYFIKGVRFLRALLANLPEDKKEMVEKIKKFLMDNEAVEHQIERLLQRYDRPVDLGRRVLLRRIQELIRLHEVEVSLILENVFQIGREKKFVDPSQTQGKM